MEKRAQLYEGKAKKVFATDDEALVLVSYKDDATAFNGQKRGTIQGKGAVNNRMSNFLMKLLEEKGIPTHLVRELSDRETLVKKVAIIPLEVIVRNIAAGGLAQRLGLAEGERLRNPVLEYCYKNDALNDPLVNDYHILALGLATREELDTLADMALRVNKLLIERFVQADLILVDFKIEFGKTPEGEIILADEISPDTCRLWDLSTGEKLDKDRFRRNLGAVEEAYAEVARRLFGE